MLPRMTTISAECQLYTRVGGAIDRRFFCRMDFDDFGDSGVSFVLLGVGAAGPNSWMFCKEAMIVLTERREGFVR